VANIQLLALFPEVAPVAEAIAQLRAAGVPDERITVLSNIPYRAEILGRPHPKGKVGLFSATGAVIGFLTAVFLTVGIFLLYPIDQGGQGIIPIPPSLIILFEVTMLGTMWAAFFGLLLANRFPKTGKQLYDPRISEGQIGLIAEFDEPMAAQVEQIMFANGARHLTRAPTEPANRSFQLFWPGLLGAVVAGGAVSMLFAFGIVQLPIPTNMAEQDSIAPQMGPRLSAPAGAVPIQGPVLIDGEPATAPNAATPNSIARGKILFGIHCALCHGPAAVGDGPLSDRFSKKPADLTSSGIQSLSDDEIFLVITEGKDPMPRLIENLDPGERWDVINFVRTLRKN
jgi:mono/diheme cytochrome c family protein